MGGYMHTKVSQDVALIRCVVSYTPHLGMGRWVTDVAEGSIFGSKVAFGFSLLIEQGRTCQSVPRAFRDRSKDCAII